MSTAREPFVSLPDCHTVEGKTRTGEPLTALEEFILSYEPMAWPACNAFRERLQAVLEEASER